MDAVQGRQHRVCAVEFCPMNTPTEPRFIHLRLHTEYSISDGIVQVGQAISRAAADGMPALGISDL
ncbi:MAG: PHP domain-containing protein, partial [Rhodocyclaceae bacterium]|nr:PHP domain-containing protein [Rhodocyclaceae bacterium]